MNWRSWKDWLALLFLLTMPIWFYFGLPENAHKFAAWLTGVDPGDSLMSKEAEHAITTAYVGFWVYVGDTVRDMFMFWLKYLPIGVVVYVAVRLANNAGGRRD